MSSQDYYNEQKERTCERGRTAFHSKITTTKASGCHGKSFMERLKNITATDTCQAGVPRVTTLDEKNKTPGLQWRASPYVVHAGTLTSPTH